MSAVDSLGGVLGNRTGECLSGTRLGSTQHPLYFLRRRRSFLYEVTARH
jgi:hypothetical protein